VFVAALGASSYTYAEATRTQQSHDFIASHTHALEYFQGVPKVSVPDQLKSGVSRACRYEATLQRTYEDWAEHYGTTVIPARPVKPQDKAKVEVAVQVAERWIVARLRNETFHALAPMNERILELLETLNLRPMRAYGQSRHERFELLDRPALRPLPRDRFQDAEWKVARVNIDYHIQLEGHYYSVPFPLVQERVEVRAADAWRSAPQRFRSRCSTAGSAWPRTCARTSRANPRTPPTGPRRTANISSGRPRGWPRASRSGLPACGGCARTLVSPRAVDPEERPRYPAAAARRDPSEPVGEADLVEQAKSASIERAIALTAGLLRECTGEVGLADASVAGDRDVGTRQTKRVADARAPLR
jgi:transposase